MKNALFSAIHYAFCVEAMSKWMWREWERDSDQLKTSWSSADVERGRKHQKNIQRGQIEKEQEGEDVEKVRERKTRECL